MNWIPGACLVVGIALVLPWLLWLEERRNHKASTVPAPSNVTRLDSRRKAGENVTVLRSVQ